MKGAKTGGRTKGTPNIITRESRVILKALVAEELHGLREHLNDLQPKERLEILLKLLPYVLPRVEPVKHNNGEPFDFAINS